MTAYSYDYMERAAGVILPDPGDGSGTIGSSFVNDLNDNRVSATDGKNNATVYVYDDFGLLVEETNAETLTTRYDYDAMGNRTKIMDPKGNITYFEYNDLNLLSQKTYADVTYETYEYYADGLLWTKTNARGTVTTYTYDPDTNDLWKVEYDDGTTPSVTYEYDTPYERVKKITDGAGVWQYAYDANARVQTVTDPWSNTVTYTYDAAGEVATVTPSDGDTTTSAYDTQGRLTQVKVGDREYNYAYTGGNELPDTLTRPNGSATAYTYDNLYRLKDIKNRKSDGATILTENAFVYDKAHMKTRETVTNGAAMSFAAVSVTYQHNNVNQLESSTGAKQDVCV